MIALKTQKEIEIMREGGRKLAEVMASLILLVKPGVATKELDRAARELILSVGGKLAFEGYDGFPGAICTCVNEEVVHSVPSSRALKEGDIVTLDIGLVWPASAKATAGEQRWFLDMARTVPVGRVDKETSRLLEVTRQSLDTGIAAAKAGHRVGDIAYAVQQTVESSGYGVVRELCGHGIG